MSRPIDQSCDNCQYQSDLGTCNQWLEECPEDTEESVRWCQYWKQRKERK